MSFLSSGVFWGAMIILFGLSILLKEIFHVHIPITRIIFGVILLYIGIRVIMGGMNRRWHSVDAIFGSSSTEYQSGKGDYNIVFGSGTIDLSKMKTVIQDEKINVSVVFGNGTLLVNDSLPLIIKGTAVFGNIVLPNQSSSAMGDIYYTSPTYSDSQPHVTIDANSVFGKLVVQKRQW